MCSVQSNMKKAQWNPFHCADEALSRGEPIKSSKKGGEMRIIQAIACLALTGCTSAPSHIPNPLVLPAAGLSTAIENGVYGARRKKVKRFVAQNWTAIQTDITKQGGAALTEAMDIAGVLSDKRPALIREVSDNSVHRTSAETMTVALMVHSG